MSLCTYSFGKTLSSEKNIHLLKTQSLCLWHNEPYEDYSEERHQSEEDKRAVCDLFDHVWRNLPNDEIGHPVGRGADGNAIGSVTERPHLRDKHPRAWSPCKHEVSTRHHTKETMSKWSLEWKIYHEYPKLITKSQTKATAA